MAAPSITAFMRVLGTRAMAEPSGIFSTPSCCARARCSLNRWNKPHSIMQCAAMGSARAASDDAGIACSGPPSFDTSRGVATFAPPTATSEGMPALAHRRIVHP